MNATSRVLLLPAAVLAAVLGILLRKGTGSDVPARPVPVRESRAAGRASPAETAATWEPVPGPAVLTNATLHQFLSRAEWPQVPADTPSGSLTVTGPREDPDALKDLALTASQRTILDALMAERDAVLVGIRREIDSGGADPDRLCAGAASAQERCMSGIRSTLLPDQRERFEVLLRSGRWGGYTLVIPHRR